MVDNNNRNIEYITCEECAKLDIFDKIDVKKCVCIINVEKQAKILRTALQTYTVLVVNQDKTIEDLLNLYDQQKYEIIKGVEISIGNAYIQAMTILKPNLQCWEYLDVGCGSMIHTESLSVYLGVLAQGIDFCHRKSSLVSKNSSHHEIVKDLLINPKIPYDRSLKLVSLTDILHHLAEPEKLVTEAISKLINGGMLMIYDYDCTSFEDVYYIDSLHYALKQNTAYPIYPVHHYRSHKYWFNFLTKKNKFKLVYHKQIDGIHKAYLAVYLR